MRGLKRLQHKLVWACFFVIVFLVLACSMPFKYAPVETSTATPNIGEIFITPITPTTPPTQTTSFSQYPSPTPDAQRTLPPLRTETVEYTVRSGDHLASIARRYGVGMSLIIDANQIENPDLIQVGQVLTIPPPAPYAPSPDIKIIPDSELVLSPSTVGFDIAAFIQEKGGYLAAYSEEVNGETLSGAEIIRRNAYNNSVNPRILLAVIEYQSGWVTQTTISEELKEYPLGNHYSWLKGLNLSMIWAANLLNQGYYLWKVNGISSWVLEDERVITASPRINAGSAGVQNLMSYLYGFEDWQKAVTENGLISTYSQLFSHPFDLTFDPLIPGGLTQPQLQLPFENGVTWYFTG